MILQYFTEFNDSCFIEADKISWANIDVSTCLKDYLPGGVKYKAFESDLKKCIGTLDEYRIMSNFYRRVREEILSIVNNLFEDEHGYTIRDHMDIEQIFDNQKLCVVFVQNSILKEIHLFVQAGLAVNILTDDGEVTHLVEGK